MTSGSGGLLRVLRDAALPDASALHRSAVMLTGAADTADQLVLATLDRVDRMSDGAGGGGPSVASQGPESELLAELVREYLRRAPRRRVDRLEPGGVAVDAGDVLRSLRPRQRAAAVLLLVEGWSAERTARVVGVHPERIPSLVPQSVGLADALLAEAYHHDGPTPRSTTAAPGHTRRRPGRRSRAARRNAAAAVVVVALGGVALAARLSGQDEGSPPPAADGGAAGAAASSGDLSGRGWVLDPYGDPPEFLEGLRLIDVSTIDYADATRPLTLDTLPRKGQAIHAALWCDMPPPNTTLVPPTLTLTLPGHAVALPCAGKHDDPPVHRFVPLPPPEDRGRVRVTLDWEGDLPGRGSAVLATYTELGQNEPASTPVVVPDAPPTVPEHAAVLDSDHLSVEVDGGAVFVQRVTVSSQTRLSVWSGGTGQFTVLVDGVIASDDGDIAHAQTAGGLSQELVWQHQDPEVRNGSWTVHAPGRTKEFPLPEGLRPAPGEEREVTVQVFVHPGTEGRWQVQASHASPVAVDIPAVPEARAFRTR